MTLEAHADSIGGRVQCTHCELKFVLEEKSNNPQAPEKNQLSVPQSTPKRKVIKKKAISVRKPASRKKVPKKSGGNKVLIGFFLTMLIALAGFFQWGRASLNDSTNKGDIAQNATAVKASKTKAAPNYFNFDKWSKKYGQPLNLDTWKSDNPIPFGRRFTPDVHYFHARYHTSLGPIGVRTLMHDMNWAHRYKTQMKHFPEVLQDADGPIANAMLVDNVVKKGPAARYLKKGDLILAIEGQALKSTQWLNLSDKFSKTENRGLEIHAGQMIDQAEGRGKIKIKVLRLPKDYQLKKIAKRKLVAKKKYNLEATTLKKVAVQLAKNTQYLSIQTDSNTKIQFTAPTLVDEKRGIRIPFYNLPKAKLYKRKKNPQFNKRYPNLTLNGPFCLHYALPKGNWKVVGELENKGRDSGTISFSTMKWGVFPTELAPYCKTFEFKIPRIGSFGKTFDPNCAKVRNYTAILAKRLATEQGPDGSWAWEGFYSYTSPAFYTSICGLGLLAEADPAYNRHIRKAAHYVAYSGSTSNWTWARGLNAMFLAEYYLRTKDESILDGFSLALKRCEQAILVGSVAGHHYHNPGYGGSGQISGSGLVASALALAEQTPARFTRGTALKMMESVQSFSVLGALPYGRAAGYRKIKSQFNLEKRWPGHGGFSGTGPYYMAAKISGGSRFFMDIVSKRLLTPPYGSTDDGHGTHTIPFVFGNMAMGLCSDKAYKANMEAFFWKFTTHRGFDGFIVNNSNPLEFHSGEFVMGKPWWSTGGWLLMMNTHKHNLAMTGKKEYMASSQKEVPLVHDHDFKAYRYILRQWCTVEAALGKKTPR
ncbi:MAG: PDZ domain-containing protein, partial [Lentisphaeraceae bacterium]|nr:PDZ domain-containing protein [Lentisphaeraceae bacterium]